MTNFRRVPNSEKFWRISKELNPASDDYRKSSDDLPLLPGEWRYKVDVYEADLAEMKKQEHNISKLDKNLHPSQR